MDTRLWCPRGGTGAAAAGHERRIPTRPGEWRQVARWSGSVAPVLRACGLCFRSRRPARRPAGSAGGFAGGPAGVFRRGPAQRAGPADVTSVSPAGLGASARELPGLLLCQAACMADRQATALSASGGRTGADEESAAAAERRKERTAGHRAVAVARVLVGTERSGPRTAGGRRVSGCSAARRAAERAPPLPVFT